VNDSPAVVVNIQRQPGANIIAVVDRIKALPPQLKAALPSSVEMAILTDRTTTIRASVTDVEFELMLVIALVVMVIFLFCDARRDGDSERRGAVVDRRHLRRDTLLGYSLNNLTLMALTISTGFVVDDAIVMIENVTRYVEAGDGPLEAALKGSEQIGFTILSLTVSLIAVLIPLLFMGDIVGRLFREFAVTLSVTILISAVVSLTLTPMMCAKLLHHRPESEQGRFYKASERAFQRVIDGYGRSLAWVLTHQTATLLVAIATLVSTVVLYIVIQKGFFPVQDTGVIMGVSEAPQSVSFTAMAGRQRALARVILKDPAVESLTSFIGIDATNTTLNTGRIQVNLKPLEERRTSASDVIRRLQPQVANVEGIKLFMQPVQDLTVESRVSRTQFQYSLEDPSAAELQTWVPRFVSRLQALPDLRDVASDQQNLGLQARVDIDRATASRLGITLPEQESSTLGGFVIARLGRMVRIGDVVTLDGYNVPALARRSERRLCPATAGNAGPPTGRSSGGSAAGVQRHRRRRRRSRSTTRVSSRSSPCRSTSRPASRSAAPSTRSTRRKRSLACRRAFRPASRAPRRRSRRR
jgi:multidrug efflux pump